MHYSYLRRKQVLFLFFWFISFLFLFSNPESQEKIVEIVKVVNVEVVVRVYQEGNPQPLKALQKNDFKLIVNGNEKEIHGFFEERKKISVEPLKKAIKVNLPPSLSPNLFVLIFNIHTCTEQMKESLETVFAKIIRPNDRVIVFTNQTLMNETVVGDIQKVKTQIWELLQTQSNEMKKKIKQMEREINELASECESMDERFLYYYKTRYKQIKNDFMQSYFNPGAKEYTAIAEYLREKKYNKWILNFYQLGVFPFKNVNAWDVDVEDYTQDSLYKSISNSFINSGATVYTLLMLTPHVVGNLPESYEYQYITTQSEIILSNIAELTGGQVIQTTNINKFVNKISKTEDVYYVLTFDPGNEEIHKINVQMTGSNNYRLVYNNELRTNDFIKNKVQPTILNAVFYDNLGIDLAKEGRFEEAIDYFSKAIQFDPENAHLYFNRGLTYFKMKQIDNALIDYTSALKLVPTYFEALYNRGLLFMQTEKFAEAVTDFTQAIGLNVNHGNSRYYRAMALEKEGNFQQALQDYNTIKEADPIFYSTHNTEIENKLKELQSKYPTVKNLTSTLADYEARLRNLFYKWNPKDSQERLRLIKEKESLPKFPEQLSDQIRLEQILKKCADYCSKLEQAVFHFYCREEVSERLFYIAGLSHLQKQEEILRRIDYEYQVIRDNKQITENRKPLRIDKLPFRNSESQQRPIAFNHQLLIYGPIMLFSENRQPLYRYNILKEELIHGEKIMIIEALPLYFQDPVPQFGNAHVKVSDGSIIGIDWNPKSIRNFQTILDQAVSHKDTFQVAFSLEMNIVKDSLHFPSRCQVKWKNEDVDNEIKSAARKKGYALTGVVTDIIYKNYKFFTVGSEIIKEEME